VLGQENLNLIQLHPVFLLGLDESDGSIEMAITHGTLIKLLSVFLSKKLIKEGITIEGICEGFSSMHLQAVVAGPKYENEFYERLDLLFNYMSKRGSTFEKLENTIDAIDETQKIPEVPAEKELRENNNLTAQERALLKKEAEEQLKKARAKRPILTEEQKKLRDIRMFVDSVFRQQMPDKTEMGELFQVQKGITPELTAPVIWDETGEYIHSNVLGIVSANKNELSTYFSDIEKLLKDRPSSEERVSFLLTSDGYHTIDVYFDPISKKWHFLDINNLEPNLLDKKYYAEVTSEELASRVFTAFEDSDNALFTIRRLSTQGYDLALMEDLEQDNQGTRQLPTRGKLYVSKDGHYTFQDSDKHIHSGKLENFDLTNLKDKLNDFDFKANLLEQMALQNPNLPITQVDKIDRSIDRASTELLLKTETKKSMFSTKKTLLLGYEKTNKRGWNALMMAVSRGKLSTVQQILHSYEMQKTPNKKLINQATTKGGHTALMLAIIYGHTEIAKALIQAGADLTQKDIKNKTVYDYALSTSNANIIVHLIKASPNKIPMLNQLNKTSNSCFNQCDDETLYEFIQTVQMLPNIDIKTHNFGTIDRKNATLLMLAAKQGHMKTLKALIQNDKSMCKAALSIAAQNGHQNMVEFLINQLGKQPENINLAIKLSAQNGHVSTLSFLINTYQGIIIDTMQDNINNALIHAAENGHVETVNLLLAAKAIPNAINHPTLKESPLMLAAKNGHLNMVLTLLGAGADTSLVNSMNKTALQIAAQHGRLSVVTQLISKTPESRKNTIETAAQYGKLPIIQALMNDPSIEKQEKEALEKFAIEIAAQYGQLDVINELIASSSRNKQEKNTLRLVALNIAIDENQVETLEALIPQLDRATITPQVWGGILLVAIKQKHPQLAEKALKARADKNYQDKNGNTPLILAVETNNEALIQKLLEDHPTADVNHMNFAGDTALTRAVDKNAPNIVTEIIMHSADNIGEASTDNKTSQMLVAGLMKAAEKGYLDIVALFSAFAPTAVTMKNEQGLSALMVAAQHGHTDIVSYLIEEGGAKEHERNNISGETPLMLAALHGHLESVLYFMEESEEEWDINEKNTNGQTALMLAALNGHTKIVKALTEYNKESVNVVDNKGNTAFMLAVQSGKIDTIEILVDFMKDNFPDKSETDLINQKNNNHDNAIMLAAQNNQYNAVEFLIKNYKPDLSISNKQGKTALQIATELGYEEIIKLLSAKSLNVAAPQITVDLNSPKPLVDQPYEPEPITFRFSADSLQNKVPDSPTAKDTSSLPTQSKPSSGIK
jgi:ankyrin repeat protein